MSFPKALGSSLALLGMLYGFQLPFREFPGVEYRLGDIPLPPDFQEKTEWAFARLMYPQSPFGRGRHRRIRERTPRLPKAFATVCDHRPHRPLAAFSGSQRDVSGHGLRTGHRHADLQRRRKQIPADRAGRFRRTVAPDSDRSDPSGIRPGGLVTMPTATYRSEERRVGKEC